MDDIGVVMTPFGDVETVILVVNFFFRIFSFGVQNFKVKGQMVHQ